MKNHQNDSLESIHKTLAHSKRLKLREPPYPAQVAENIGNTAFKGLSPINLRLALAHHPKLATAFQSMAHVVLFQCELPERDREIAIIRTGALTRSEYEWGMHVSIYAEKCKLDSASVGELTTCSNWTELSNVIWSPKERLIVRMVDEIHSHSTVSDETWLLLNRDWPQEQVIELIFSSSFYHMAAFFLNTTAVPLEVGAERFPNSLEQAFAP